MHGVEHERIIRSAEPLFFQTAPEHSLTLLIVVRKTVNYEQYELITRVAEHKRVVIRLYDIFVNRQDRL